MLHPFPFHLCVFMDIAIMLSVKLNTYTVLIWGLSDAVTLCRELHLEWYFTSKERNRGYIQAEA